MKKTKEQEHLINLVYTAREADQLWGLSTNAVTTNCNRGRFTNEEARKSSKVWLVTDAGMRRVFGEPKE